MAVNIHTNIPSLRAQRELTKTNDRLKTSVLRMSSGYRINSAADDAAGLAISEEMKADLRSLQQAMRNSSDAKSMLQVAEGGMDDIGSILMRLRELAMQSASDGVNDTQRGYINVEVNELQSEIDRIVGEAEYNGTSLLDGTLSADFQVGLDSGDVITWSITAAIDAAGLSVDAGGVDLSSKAGAVSSLAIIDTALETLSSLRAELGAKQNRLSVVESNIGVMHDNLAAANGRIRDADVAHEMASLTKEQILMQAGTAMLSQANQLPQLALSLIGG